MTGQRPISCEAHDYLEIACLYRYEIQVQRRDLRVVIGRAVTTRTAPTGVEYLVLVDGGGSREVAMHDIQAIRVRTANARFESLRLDSQGQPISQPHLLSTNFRR